jgi:hypothetical protein
MSARAVLLVPILLAGCAPTQAPTWHADVGPMMDTYCTRCHFEGGPGTGDFTRFDEAVAWAEPGLARVDAGEMPPPASDPSCRSYHGHEHMTLPGEARDLLADWIDGGKAEGDPEEAVAVERLTLELDDPDVVILLPEAYAPNFDEPQSPDNEYRCFLLETEATETFYITEMAPILDATHLIHHIVIYRLSEASVPDDYDPAVGYECQNDLSQVIIGMIAGWAPGMVPVVFEPGTGVRVEPGSRIGLQFHYFRADPAQEAVLDRSGYSFNITDEVKTEARMFPIGTSSFNIPAGDENYTREGDLSLPEGLGAITIHGVMPHMHVLGSAFRMWVGRDEDEQCIVDMKNYDFDNQLTYMLDPPLHIAPGERIHYSCSWDNSAENPDQFFDPPRDIRYGERTDEEMCFGFTLVSFTP